MNEERGSALIDGVLLAIVLLLPMIWLFGIMSEAHRSALAATAAAREGGAAAVQALDRSSASRSVETAVVTAFENHGLDAAAARVRWSGRIAPGRPVEIVVSYPVRILQAPFLGQIGEPNLWIRARHAAQADRYRSDG